MNPYDAQSSRHFRAHARRPVSLPATLVAGGGSWRCPARLVDLGLGGACIALAETVPPGSPVALVIDAPHLWNPLAIDGVVAWVGEEQTGPQTFLGIEFRPDNGGLLRALIELLEAAAFG